MADFTHDGTGIPRAPAKDPDSTIDYGVDWSGVLQTGETISQSIWVIPPGLTGSNESVNGSDTAVFLAGGTAYELYTVTNRITTSLGRVIDRSFELQVLEL